MKHLLLADRRGNKVCDINLAAHLRTGERFIVLRKGGNHIELPLAQVYELSDMLVGIAEACEQREHENNE